MPKKLKAAPPEPPRGQIKGPINWKLPATLVYCPLCKQGMRRRYAGKHLQDHQAGLIQKPVEK